MDKLYVLNGPDAGRAFQLKEGANTVGRSLENDITLQGKTVSRHHLRIVKQAQEYFLTDLASKNGTFFGGKYLPAEMEREVKEGVPIAIGMTLIAIGESSMTLSKPLLEAVGLTEEIGEESGIFSIHKEKTNQKKLETIYRVANVLEQKLPLKEALNKVVDVIAELLVEIDTSSFILVDPNTTKVVLFSHRSRNTLDVPTLKFSPQVLYEVIKGKKAVMISNSGTEEVRQELASTLKMHGISSCYVCPDDKRESSHWSHIRSFPEEALRF